MKFATFTRRQCLAITMASLAVVAGAPAAAQDWPARPIKLIVPFPPGGPTDTASRVVGQKLAERLKQPVVVENRAGASGTIAAQFVAKSAPDGYTLMMLATPTLLAPHLYKAAGYDIAKDFAPVATVYDLPIVVVVNPTVLPDVKTLPDLIAKAKAEKGKLNYTSSGPGSFGHLTMEMLKDLGGFDMQHIAYKGGTPAVTDLLGGQVQLMFDNVPNVLPHVKAGKLTALGQTGTKRSPLIADVPTVAEAGVPGYEVTVWFGLVAPAGTPREVVQKLNAEALRILAMPDVRERFLAQGVEPAGGTPEQFAEHIRAQMAKWAKVVADAGVKAE